jgi:hypothetical protein
VSDPPATVADRLAADLEAGGALVARGGFEIDAVAGLDQLGRYQLADPAHYVLRLAEAGARLGAEQIGFWIGRGELVVRYVNHDQPITLAPELHRRLLWVLVGELDGLEQVEREAIIQLAIGVNAAIARGHAQVWVDSVGADRRGARLAFDGREQRFVAIEDGDPGLSVHVRGHRRGLLRPTFEARAEAALLRERVRWSQTAIYLDDLCISGHRFVNGTPVVDEAGDTIGEATIDDGEPPPCIVLLAAGVEIERLSPDASPGFLAVVEAALPRDLSRTEFIRGPEFDAFIAGVLDHQFRTSRTPTVPNRREDELAFLFFPLTRKGRKRVRAAGLVTLVPVLSMILAINLSLADGLILASFGAAMISGFTFLMLWASAPRDKNERTRWMPKLSSPAPPAVATLGHDALPPGTTDADELDADALKDAR